MTIQSQTIKINPKGVINLPKIWAKKFSSRKAVVAMVDNTLVINTFEREPDYSIDEKNWQNIKTQSLKTRKELFKKRYPKLYAKFNF
jgi:hypothetical protein